MLKRLTLAIIIAILTTLGIVIPSKYIDGFVSLFMPEAHATELSHPSSIPQVAWEIVPFSFRLDVGGSEYRCSKVSGNKNFGNHRELKLTEVEALRPSLAHFSADRSSGVLESRDVGKSLHHE